ncbi:MAG: OsmC family protein [Halobacteriales archaeon]|nr:OsmC family protein [Halobacteriales archaeon]
MADEQSTATSLSHYELTGSRMSPKRMHIDTGDAEFVVGDDVNPIEYLLGSVLACLNSTATMVARDMDIDIESMEASIEADVDYARYRGEDTDARAGLQAIQVELAVTTAADSETLETWRAAVEDRCPVTDNIVNETPFGVTVERA